MLRDKLPGERVLAARLEVSYMTVRKAIAELVDDGVLHKQGTRGTFVSSKTNKSKATGNFGFFLDSEIREGISSPYYSLVFKALEKEVSQHGFNLLLFSDFDDLNPLYNSKKVDALIVCNFPRIEQRLQEIKRYFPIVLLDNIASDKSIPSVTIDNFNSCSNSGEYLISLGHRRIGFVSGLLDSDICKDRLLGYKNALKKHGLSLDESMIYKGNYSYESGELAGLHFIAQNPPPTAIICANDSMAIGAMKVIREHGIRIPEDISIIGFDDVLVSSKVFPPLTTSAAPIREISRIAVEILIEELNGKDDTYKHVILEAPLVKRASCTSPQQNTENIS